MSKEELKQLIEQAYEDAETISDFKHRVFKIIDISDQYKESVKQELAKN